MAADNHYRVGDPLVGKGIVATTTKTGRTRHVPAPLPVWERLKHELPDDGNALVFPRMRGGLLPIEEYRRAFHKAHVSRSASRG